LSIRARLGLAFAAIGGRGLTDKARAGMNKLQLHSAILDFPEIKALLEAEGIVRLTLKM